jgi:hypothetical protein
VEIVCLLSGKLFLQVLSRFGFSRLPKIGVARRIERGWAAALREELWDEQTGKTGCENPGIIGETAGK